MKLPKKVIEELVVRPGSRAGLMARSTSGTDLDRFGPTQRASAKEIAERDLEDFKRELGPAQELLFASDTWSVLVVLQGLDASGKDGTIKHVLSGINPLGCTIVAFSEPSVTELRHDFLWRCVAALPERGRIGIFNRSYYEDVLVVRVHPELLEDRRFPPEMSTGHLLFTERFEDINAFERHLVRNGTRVIKIFLHLSKEEQRRRFLKRLDDPAKQWKFSMSDLRDRPFFDAFQDAYEETITETSTPWAPWYVVPADHKPAMRALVGGIIVDVIDGLDLRIPPVDAEQRAVLKKAKLELDSERD